MALTRAAMVAGVLFVEACSPFGGGAFHCDTSDQCTGGFCEPEGLCSFSDDDCASGRRFGDLSGPLAGVCVGEGTPTDAPDSDDALVDMALSDTPGAAFCDAGDPTLVGCWEFENNADDASGEANHATATGVSYVTGKVGMAVVQQAGSSLVVGDRGTLEPQHLTVEAWIRPSTLPTGRWGLIDSDGAYGIFITATNILCSFGGALTVNTVVPVDVWTHVACTTDGATVRLYVDGVDTQQTIAGTPLGTGNTNGIVLGANSPSGDTLIGAIDQMRVFTEARTPAQICRAAGLANCN